LCRPFGQISAKHRNYRSAATGGNLSVNQHEHSRGVGCRTARHIRLHDDGPGQHQGRLRRGRALEHTQSGQPVTWKSDRSGLYGTVVAAQPYRVGSQDCRQYSHTVFASGQSRNARGTACRNADGSWTPLT
jgi:hypothetical protein